MKVKKIITVTLNPAVDKTLFIDKLNHNSINRILRTVQDVGGKGINVARTIQKLGGSSVAAGFLGRQGSGRITGWLDDNKITHDFTMVEGGSRTNTKLVEADGNVTELNEQGPVVAEKDIGRLEKKLLAYAGEGALFVFAGSIPPGADPSVYERLIGSVHNKGSLALLDAQGKPFASGMKAVPDIIKPNREEAAEYLGGAGVPEDEWGRLFIEKGVKTALLSCGRDGAYFTGREGTKIRHKYCRALPISAVSTVGAGDAMTGAFCYACLKGLDFEEMSKLCMAVSAGAVMTEGTKPPEMTLVQELMNIYFK